jgi:hypothetical protein
MNEKIAEEDVLRLQLAETQLELARTRTAVADQELAKVRAFVVEKYRLDLAAGDAIDQTTREIVRGKKEQ